MSRAGRSGPRSPAIHAGGLRYHGTLEAYECPSEKVAEALRALEGLVGR